MSIVRSSTSLRLCADRSFDTCFNCSTRMCLTLAPSTTIFVVRLRSRRRLRWSSIDASYAATSDVSVKGIAHPPVRLLDLRIHDFLIRIGSEHWHAMTLVTLAVRALVSVRLVRCVATSPRRNDHALLTCTITDSTGNPHELRASHSATLTPHMLPTLCQHVATTPRYVRLGLAHVRPERTSTGDSTLFAVHVDI